MGQVERSKDEKGDDFSLDPLPLELAVASLRDRSDRLLVTLCRSLHRHFAGETFPALLSELEDCEIGDSILSRGIKGSGVLGREAVGASEAHTHNAPRRQARKPRAARSSTRRNREAAFAR